MDKIRNYSIQEFIDFSIKELSSINDIPLLILKGHILVEYSLNCYLEAKSINKESNFFKEQFTFATKVKIAKHFTVLGSTNDDIIKEINILNKIRNEIAHKLTYNENLLTQLFSEVKKKSPKGIFSKRDAPIKEKIIGAIAFINGALFGAYKLYTDNEDLENYLDKNK